MDVHSTPSRPKSIFGCLLGCFGGPEVVHSVVEDTGNGAIAALRCRDVAAKPVTAHDFSPRVGQPEPSCLGLGSQETAAGHETSPTEEAQNGLRDTLVLETSPCIITVFALRPPHRVIHQNPGSKAYFGCLLQDSSITPPQMRTLRGSTRMADDTLASVFALDPNKLEILLSDISDTTYNRVWRGVVRVPPLIGGCTTMTMSSASRPLSHHGEQLQTSSFLSITSPERPTATGAALSAGFEPEQCLSAGCNASTVHECIGSLLLSEPEEASAAAGHPDSMLSNSRGRAEDPADLASPFVTSFWGLPVPERSSCPPTQPHPGRRLLPNQDAAAAPVDAAAECAALDAGAGDIRDGGEDLMVGDEVADEEAEGVEEGEDEEEEEGAAGPVWATAPEPRSQRGACCSALPLRRAPLALGGAPPCAACGLPPAPVRHSMDVASLPPGGSVGASCRSISARGRLARCSTDIAGASFPGHGFSCGGTTMALNAALSSSLRPTGLGGAGSWGQSRVWRALGISGTGTLFSRNRHCQPHLQGVSDPSRSACGRCEGKWRLHDPTGATAVDAETDDALRPSCGSAACGGAARGALSAQQARRQPAQLPLGLQLQQHQQQGPHGAVDEAEAYRRSSGGGGGVPSVGATRAPSYSMGASLCSTGYGASFLDPLATSTFSLAFHMSSGLPAARPSTGNGATVSNGQWPPSRQRTKTSVAATNTAAPCCCPRVEGAASCAGFRAAAPATTSSCTAATRSLAVSPLLSAHPAADPLAVPSPSLPPAVTSAAGLPVSRVIAFACSLRNAPGSMTCSGTLSSEVQRSCHTAAPARNVSCGGAGGGGAVSVASGDPAASAVSAAAATASVAPTLPSLAAAAQQQQQQEQRQESLGGRQQIYRTISEPPLGVFPVPPPAAPLSLSPAACATPGAQTAPAPSTSTTVAAEAATTAGTTISAAHTCIAATVTTQRQLSGQVRVLYCATPTPDGVQPLPVAQPSKGSPPTSPAQPSTPQPPVLPFPAGSAPRAGITGARSTQRRSSLLTGALAANSPAAAALARLHAAPSPDKQLRGCLSDGEDSPGPLLGGSGVDRGTADAGAAFAAVGVSGGGLGAARGGGGGADASAPMRVNGGERDASGLSAAAAAATFTKAASMLEDAAQSGGEGEEGGRQDGSGSRPRASSLRPGACSWRASAAGPAPLSSATASAASATAPAVTAAAGAAASSDRRATAAPATEATDAKTMPGSHPPTRRGVGPLGAPKVPTRRPPPLPITLPPVTQTAGIGHPAGAGVPAGSGVWGGGLALSSTASAAQGSAAAAGASGSIGAGVWSGGGVVGGAGGAEGGVPEECWHEVWATRAVDPPTGEEVVILAQHDVTAKVIAERHLALVMETEHRLLEQLFPRHILQYITEEWTAEVAGASVRARAGPAGPSCAVTPQKPTAAASGPRPQQPQQQQHHLGRGPWQDPGQDPDSERAPPPTRSQAQLQLLLQQQPQLAASRSRRWQPVVRDCSTLATWHNQVTLLFADIKGFTPMCKEVQPRAVMSMLNDLFSRFDSLLDECGVYKVETIGDCYFVAGGLVHEDEDGMVAVRGAREDPQHAHKVLKFAKAMLREAAQVPLPTTGGAVEIRVGLHSGPVVSGVVGTRMPRFCLFGDTVNTASRMESSGVPGCIHASAATHALLPGEDWTPTGGIEVKGKGHMQTWLWRPPAEEPAAT